MKKKDLRSLIRHSVAAICAVLSICGNPSILSAQGLTTVTITDDVLHTDVKPFGINVGSRNRWGEAQILNNLIDNPGFEAGVMGMVALADDSSTAQSFRQAYWDPAWGGHPEGFWDGGSYEIVWGTAKGRAGTIERFRHESGSNVFDLDGAGTASADGDVMFVRTTVPGINGNTAIADPAQARLGSPGTQSLRLASTGTAQWDFYMDSYWRDGDRSIGKMLPVKGAWRVLFWAKGAAGGETARIRFFREGSTDFLDRTITLTSQWKMFEWVFVVPDGADPLREYTQEEYRPILDFRLQAVSGTVWFDDVALERADQTNPTVFTDLFVQRLKELRPGILRDWSNQLGSTLENQLAETWGRKTNGYKPGEGAGSYAYSLPEFLALCREVGAEPWYVIPPTFSPEDLQNLVEYLAAPPLPAYPYAMRRAAMGQATPWTEIFPTIHLEFGNELWGGADANDPFQGASLRGGVRLGAVASDRFQIMRSSPVFDLNRLNLIIGGQAGYPGRQQEIEANAIDHDAIALAPYFGILDTWNNDQEIFAPLLAHPANSAGPEGVVRASYDFMAEKENGTELAIYEINFHTTGGNAPIEVRNDFVTGAGGALALPLAMLTYQKEFGALNQAAFSSLGYSFRLGSGDYVRIWGLLRDLYATGRKRPTWLGLEAVNKAIPQRSAFRFTQPKELDVRVEGARPTWVQNPINGIGKETEVEKIQAFAFQLDNGGLENEYGLVLMNLDLDAGHDVEIKVDEFWNSTYPFNTHDIVLYSIAPGTLHQNNETEQSVRIDSTAIESGSLFSGYRLTLPPHSLQVLAWKLTLTEGVEAREEGSGLSLSSPVPLGEGSSLRYAIPAAGNVRLDLIDITGSRVQSLVDGRMEKGEHRVALNGEKGTPIVPGIYFLRLQSGAQTLVRKVFILQ